MESGKTNNRRDGARTGSNAPHQRRVSSNQQPRATRRSSADRRVVDLSGEQPALKVKRSNNDTGQRSRATTGRQPSANTGRQRKEATSKQLEENAEKHRQSNTGRQRKLGSGKQKLLSGKQPPMLVTKNSKTKAGRQAAARPGNQTSAAADARPGATGKSGSQSAVGASRRKSVGLGGSANADAVLEAKAQAATAKRALKIGGIVVGALALVYAIGVIVFSVWFVPNTKMGIFDLSMKSTAAAEQMIDNALKDYSITVSGDGFSFTATAYQTGLAADSKSAVEGAHEELNGWKWPILLLTGPHDVTSKLGAKGDEGSISKLTEEAVNKFNEDAEPPVQANIEYDEAQKTFVVVPEKEGTQLDTQAIVDAVNYSVANLEPQLNLGSEYVLKPAVYSTDDRLSGAIEQANKMLGARVALKMDGVEVAVVDSGVLAKMIAIDSEVNPILGDSGYNDWEYGFIPKVDTVGSTRTFTREDGKSCTVSGGVFGWRVDEATLREQLQAAAIDVKQGDLEVPCSQKGDVFSGAGERDWRARYVDVDISEQHCRFFDEGGSIIWEADCITGQPDGERDTVPGVWTVNDKKSPSRLIGKKNGVVVYETDVTYWMPFEDDSIGFHDATWQTRFGSGYYEWGAGSHGCVNLSLEDAGALYGILQIGDVVVVHS